MNILLDTHIFLWFISGDARLSSSYQQAVLELIHLPALHSDPFDRLLVCQALHDGLTVATVDAIVRSYPITIL
jgi:PIN domain nuclease of toxin-antitoxin system